MLANKLPDGEKTLKFFQRIQRIANADPVVCMEATARRRGDIFNEQIVSFADFSAFISNLQAGLQVAIDDPQLRTALSEGNLAVRPLVGNYSLFVNWAIASY